MNKIKSLFNHPVPTKPVVYILTLITFTMFLNIWALGAISPDIEITPVLAQEKPLEVQNEALGGNLVEVSCYTGWESWGANGREDNVSVATYRYPQGSWISIEGIGDRRVDTVTAERYADRVDVWFGDSYEDYLECLAFGLQYLTVKIL